MWTKATSHAAATLIVAAMAGAALAFLAGNVLRDGHADVIEGDGRGYYAWTRSLLFDHDVDFAAEYAAGVMPPGPEPPRTPIGFVANKYFVGLSLTEAVPVLFARGATALFGLADSPLPGYANLYEVSVALWLLGFGFGGLAMMVGRTVGASRGDGFGAVLLAAGTLGATNLIEYATRCLSFTHLIDIAVACLLWAVADRGRLTDRWYLLGGFLGGFS